MAHEAAPRQLTPRAAQLLGAGDEERIEHIKRRIFVSHGRAKQILAEMEELLIHPPVERMPNLLIVGPSNSGKTEILREFMRRHPAEERLGEEAIYAPVIFLQCPPGPDEDMFLTRIMRALRIRSRQSAKQGDRIDQVAETLLKVRNRILLVDELNSLLAGSVTKQGLVLNTLKYLSNEVKISIVASGTKDALQALATDDQLENRFPPLLLPRWEGATEEYRVLVSSFESTLPLRHPSHLSTLDTSKVLFGCTDGTTGALADLIRRCAQQAIHDKSERITTDLIRKIANRARPDPSELKRL